MSLGKFIKNARIEKGLTHWGLFRKSNVSVSYIKALENDMSNPNPEILKKLSGPLSIKYSELMKAAGYLDDVIDISEAIKLKFGILFRDDQVATVLATPGVREILEALHELPESKRDLAIKSIRSVLEAIQ